MSFASVNSALTYRDGGKQTSLDYDQLVNILYEGQKTTFLAPFWSHSVQRGSRRRRGDFLRVGYYWRPGGELPGWRRGGSQLLDFFRERELSTNISFNPSYHLILMCRPHPRGLLCRPWGRVPTIPQVCLIFHISQISHISHISLFLKIFWLHTFIDFQMCGGGWQVLPVPVPLPKWNGLLRGVHLGEITIHLQLFIPRSSQPATGGGKQIAPLCQVCEHVIFFKQYITAVRALVWNNGSL